MTRNPLFVAAILCLSLSSTRLLAQDIPAPPPEVSQFLASMVGTWEVTGTATMGDQSVPITGHMECQQAAAGAGVACTSRWMGIPGVPEALENDLMGWDPGDGLIHWYSVTNTGDTHDHAGGVAGNVAVFEHSGPLGGQLFGERITLTFVDDTHIQMESTAMLGAQSLFAMQGTAVQSM